MEQQSVTVGKGNEGIGTPTTGTTELPIGFFAGDKQLQAEQTAFANGPEVSVPGQPGIGQESERIVSQTPPELQPDKDGNPPTITPELIRKLRGRYFTVKHPRLLDCNHRLDMVNFPKRNCHTCLFNWFNAHAQLVETAHEMYQKHGKEVIIAMRGVKFYKAFRMFLSTIAHFQKEAQEKNVTDNQEGNLPESTVNASPEYPVTPDTSLSPAVEG